MPPPPPVPLAAKVSVQGTINATDFTNIFHFLWDTAPTSTNMQELASTAFNSYGVNIMPNVHPSFVLTHVIAEDLSAVPALPGSHVGSTAGGSAGSDPGSQLCVLVKHVIARRYRGGHPRTYLPPAPTSELLTTSLWAPGLVTAIQTGWNTFVGAILSATYTGTTMASYINVSYRSGNAPRVTPVVDLITGSIVEQMVATQRRRVGR
jgi:hypothetical protein